MSSTTGNGGDNVVLTPGEEGILGKCLLFLIITVSIP